MVGKRGACEECERTCQLLHWTKKDLEPRVTRFFKIMIGPDFQEALFLPPKYAKTVKDLVDQETKVEDSSGTCWPVTLSYYKNLIAFHKGWSKFSVDKDLQVGDFLVVNRIRGGHFVVQIFGRDGCEKLHAARKHLQVRRARTSENIAAESTPCQTACRDTKRKSPRTSVQIQQTEKQLSMDNEFDLMVDRDTVYTQGDYGTHLYDLSSFEMQKDIGSAGNNEKRIDKQEGSAGHVNLVDKNPTERVVSRNETAVTSNIVENNKVSRPMGPADNCRNGDIPNVAVACQSPNRSSGSALQSPLSIGRNLNKVFEMAAKDKVPMTEQASCCGRKRVFEPSTKEVGGSSFAAPDMNKVVKIEPVDSLDERSTEETSVTFLSETNGSVYINLPDPLPSVSFHRGRQGRTSIVFEDPEGRDWAGLYHEKFGYHVLVAPWRKVNQENAIRPGDRLVFTVADASLNKYKFTILRNHPGT